MSRKLDALVHERVFDRPVKWTEKGKLLKADYDPDIDGIDLHVAIFHRAAMEVPDYYSDIAAAWQAVDKIIADDNGINQIEIGSDCQQDAPDVWYCLFVHGEFGEWPYATAKTPALAIDLAVLRAVGVSEAEIQEAQDADDTA